MTGWTNDEMGKAAHVGVGRLLHMDCVDGAQGRGCMNNALASTNQAVRLKKIYNVNWG